MMVLHAMKLISKPSILVSISQTEYSFGKTFLSIRQENQKKWRRVSPPMQFLPASGALCHPHMEFCAADPFQWTQLDQFKTYPTPQTGMEALINIHKKLTPHSYWFLMQLGLTSRGGTCDSLTYCIFGWCLCCSLRRHLVQMTSKPHRTGLMYKRDPMQP